MLEKKASRRAEVLFPHSLFPLLHFRPPDLFAASQSVRSLALPWAVQIGGSSQEDLGGETQRLAESGMGMNRLTDVFDTCAHFDGQNGLCD